MRAQLYLMCMCLHWMHFALCIIVHQVWNVRFKDHNEKQNGWSGIIPAKDRFKAICICCFRIYSVDWVVFYIYIYMCYGNLIIWLGCILYILVYMHWRGAIVGVRFESAWSAFRRKFRRQRVCLCVLYIIAGNVSGRFLEFGHEAFQVRCFCSIDFYQYTHQKYNPNFIRHFFYK